MHQDKTMSPILHGILYWKEGHFAHHGVGRQCELIPCYCLLVLLYWLVQGWYQI